MKKLILPILLCLMGCAEKKTLIIDDKYVVVEPYGWANEESLKNDSVVYNVSIGNVVWSVILCETIVAPLVLTGGYLYEPVKVKTK